MTKKTMTFLLVTAFIFSSLLLITSCAKKHVGGEDTGVTKATPTAPAAPAAQPSAPKAAAPPARPAPPKKGDVEAERMAMEIMKFENQHIYFDFDKAELKSEARARLTDKAAFLRANTQYSIVISGHCDERGTNEYNLALGERRANAALKFLNALGISANRMKTISYGEERPVDKGHTENAWAKNRRDEFELIK